METRDNEMMELEEDFTSVEKCLERADQREKMGFRTQVLEYLRQAVKLYLQNHKEDKFIADLYRRIGNIYASLCCYYLAYGYLSKSHDLYIRLLGEDDPIIAESYFNLGNFFMLKKDYYNASHYYSEAYIKKLPEYGSDAQEMIPYALALARAYNLGSTIEPPFMDRSTLLDRVILNYDNLLKLYRKYYNNNDLKVAELLIEIGDVYKNILKLDGDNEWDKAIIYWNEAIGIYIANYKEESQEVAYLFYIVGCAIRNFKLKNKRALGRYDKISNKYLLKSLEIYNKLDSAESEIAMKINYKLARNYLKYDVKKAIECLIKRLNICEKVFGKDNEYLEQCYMDLVEAYELIGNEKAVKKTMDEYDQMYSRQHPFTIPEGAISAKECLERAEVCVKNNQLDYANDYYKKAANLYSKNKEEIKQAEVYMKIAYNHIEHNYHRQNAVEYFRKAVAIYDEKGAKDEIMLAKLKYELAYEYNRTYHEDYAIIYLKEAKKTYLKQAEKYKKELINIYFELGMAYKNLENVDLAMKYFKEVIRMGEELGCFNEKMPLSYIHMAKCNEKSGNLKDSIRYCVKATELYETVKDKYEREYIKCYLMMGRYRQELKLYDKAIEVLFKAAYQISIENIYSDVTHDICAALADNYMYINNLPLTAKWREKALLVQKYKYPSQFVSMAALFEKTEEYEKAAQYYEIAIYRAKQFEEDDGILEECYERIYDLYKKIGLYAAAEWCRKEFT